MEYKLRRAQGGVTTRWAECYLIRCCIVWSGFWTSSLIEPKGELVSNILYVRLEQAIRIVNRHASRNEITKWGRRQSLWNWVCDMCVAYVYTKSTLVTVLSGLCICVRLWLDTKHWWCWCMNCLPQNHIEIIVCECQKLLWVMAGNDLFTNSASECLLCC